MTSPTNEQQRVNMLDVLDDVANALANYSLSQKPSDRVGHALTMKTRDEFRVARAAVAELIETQRELLLEIERARTYETDVMQRIPCDTLARANAALANVGAQK